MIPPDYTIVVLVRDLPDENLVEGDVGTIVLTHIDENGSPIGYELEISSVTGECISTVGVQLSDVRPASDNDRIHARPAA